MATDNRRSATAPSNPKKNGLTVDTVAAALFTLRDMRQMSAQHIRASRDRFVSLVDRVAAQNHQVAADSGLRIDHGVAPDHGSALPHLPADIHAPKENEDTPRQIALHLHRAEQAGSVMHLLARRPRRCPRPDTYGFPGIGRVLRQRAVTAEPGCLEHVPANSPLGNQPAELVRMLPRAGSVIVQSSFTGR